MLHMQRKLLSFELVASLGNFLCAKMEVQTPVWVEFATYCFLFPHVFVRGAMHAQ